MASNPNTKIIRPTSAILEWSGTTGLYDIEWNATSITFDGLDFPTARTQYVDVGSAVLFPDTGNFTFECLLEVDSGIADDGMIASSNTGTTTYLYSNTNFGSATNELRLYHGTHGEVVVGSDIRGDGIVRVSLVRDGSTFTIYVDGTSVGTGTQSGDIGTTTASELGRAYSATTRRLEGRMYDVRVWDHARTVSDIQKDLRANLTGTETGLTHLWKMDEGSGTSVTDSTGTSDGTAAVDDWGISSSTTTPTVSMASP